MFKEGDRILNAVHSEFQGWHVCRVNVNADFFTRQERFAGGNGKIRIRVLRAHRQGEQNQETEEQSAHAESSRLH